MRIAKEDVPIKIDAPGAVARQQTEFGDASGFGKISGEYFSLGAGADLAPLLSGLEGDLCQCPHWGYVMQGLLTVTYGSGEAERAGEGDLFYWPPGIQCRRWKIPRWCSSALNESTPMFSITSSTR